MANVCSSLYFQHTVQELESQRGALEKSQKEAQKLESHVKETQSKADEARYLKGRCAYGSLGRPTVDRE